MHTVMMSVASVFGLLVVGQALQRFDAFDDAFWSTASRMAYWVLMPALLFSRLSVAKFDGDLLVPYSAALVGSFAVAVIAALIGSLVLSVSRGTASSVLQGASRHNTFIALAMLERLFGASGLALASLAAAILMLVTNLTVTPLMVGLGHNGGPAQLRRAIARDVARNPVLISIFAGLTVNLVVRQPLPVVQEVTTLMGDAVLPLMLLCVGATLCLGAMRGALRPLLFASSVKLIVFPATAFAIAVAAGLDGVPLVVVTIFAAVPTAVSSQALAREMGGDVPLMASIVSAQTAAAFLTLPVVLFLLRGTMGSP